jgi:RPA family protein
MKLKRIFPFLIAILALMTSCTDEETMTLLDGIQVSSSYVAIPVEGGSTSITVMAKDSWTVEKVTTTKNPVEWLTISSTSGNAGETTLTFSAQSTLDGRTAEVKIQSGSETQRINIIQGLATISTATCAEVIAGPDSKTYKVTGVCTAIANTQYGNWYLEDETGSIYIYGTLDSKGAEKNFLSLGLEVGDEVTVQGPKTTYGSTVELVNVSVIKINKSLVKVDSVANAMLPLEGGEFVAYLTCKGQGVSVDIPDNAASWLSISSIQSAGTNTVVKFKAAANTGGDRGTTLTFRTTDGSKEYSAQTTLSQKGAIIEASIANFIAAANKTTQYRLKGVISRITDAAKGRFYIYDYSGEVYVYNMSGFQNLGVKVGDIVTLVGKYDVYNGTHEVVSAVLESSIPVTTATIADVLTKPDDANTYFMVTGTITSITSADYGNLYLKDGDSEIYVYGCYPGYGATGNDRKGLLAAKGIKVGDTLTVIAPKGSYNGTMELLNSIYFSHVSN